MVWPGVKMRCKCCGGAHFVVVWTPAWQPSPCPWRVGQHPPKAGPLRDWGRVASALFLTAVHTLSLFLPALLLISTWYDSISFRLPATERTSEILGGCPESVHTCSTSIRKCSALGGGGWAPQGWRSWATSRHEPQQPACRWCRCRDQLSTGIEKIRGVSLILCLKTCQNIEKCLLLARSGCLDPVSGLC